jgi:hypothetical protein
VRSVSDGNYITASCLYSKTDYFLYDQDCNKYPVYVLNEFSMCGAAKCMNIRAAHKN